jgi:predicted dehydrogenase
MGVIHFENGAALFAEASWALNGPSHEEDVKRYGTEGGLDLNPLTVYGECSGYLSDQSVATENEDKFYLEIHHFADCLLNGKEPVFPVDQAVMLQAMLQGIYDAAEAGHEIVVDLD